MLFNKIMWYSYTFNFEIIFVIHVYNWQKIKIIILFLILYQICHYLAMKMLTCFFPCSNEYDAIIIINIYYHNNYFILCNCVKLNWTYELRHMNYVHISHLWQIQNIPLSGNKMCMWIYVSRSFLFMKIYI